jgi:hypothetical protein
MRKDVIEYIDLLLGKQDKYSRAAHENIIDIVYVLDCYCVPYHKFYGRFRVGQCIFGVTDNNEFFFNNTKISKEEFVKKLAILVYSVLND